MGEHLPSPEQPRRTDDDFIREAIQAAHESEGEERFLSDAAARMIASQLHGGQASALYSFASTGAVSVEVVEEVNREIRDESNSDEVREWADELQQYLIHRDLDGRLDPVEGWHKLWLGEKPSLVDKAQKLYDQEAPYQRFVEEFTKEELIELWETHCKGNPEAGFDDEVYDALLIAHGYFFKGGGAGDE